MTWLADLFNEQAFEFLKEISRLEALKRVAHKKKYQEGAARHDYHPHIPSLHKLINKHHCHYQGRYDTTNMFQKVEYGGIQKNTKLEKPPCEGKALKRKEI